MMKRYLVIGLIILGLFMSSWNPSQAEIIILKRGSKIIGKVEDLDKEQIKVTTEFGELEVKKEDIKSIYKDGASVIKESRELLAKIKESINKILEIKDGDQRNEEIEGIVTSLRAMSETCEGILEVISQPNELKQLGALIQEINQLIKLVYTFKVVKGVVPSPPEPEPPVLEEVPEPEPEEPLVSRWQAGEKLRYYAKWNESSKWAGTRLSWQLKEEWWINLEVIDVDEDGSVEVKVVFSKIKASFKGEAFRSTYGGGSDFYGGADSKKMPKASRLSSIPALVEGKSITISLSPDGEMACLDDWPQEEYIQFRDQYWHDWSNKRGELERYSWGHYNYARMLLCRLFLGLTDEPIDKKNPWCVECSFFLQSLTYFTEKRMGEFTENISSSSKKEITKQDKKYVILKFTSEVNQSRMHLVQKKGKGSGEMRFDADTGRLMSLKSKLQFTLSSHLDPLVKDPEVPGFINLEIKQVELEQE